MDAPRFFGFLVFLSPGRSEHAGRCLTSTKLLRHSGADPASISCEFEAAERERSAHFIHVLEGGHGAAS